MRQPRSPFPERGEVLMSDTSTIRILESDPNRRGDLFVRGLGDLFTALGYEDLHFDIQKAGREIDVQGIHRTEHRRLVAECKAVDEKIGGGDVNKFIGALDAEERKAQDWPMSGYFVSLSGFTETALEQERDFSPPRITLLNSPRVVSELVKGRIVCSEERAALRAGKCLAEGAPGLASEGSAELALHESGWMWLLYFGQHKRKTHFALVHADGQPLAKEVADVVIGSDASIGGSLNHLAYLSPTADQEPTQASVRAAEARYLSYPAADFGAIELTS